MTQLWQLYEIHNFTYFQLLLFFYYIYIHIHVYIIYIYIDTDSCGGASSYFLDESRKATNLPWRIGTHPPMRDFNDIYQKRSNIHNESSKQILNLHSRLYDRCPLEWASCQDLEQYSKNGLGWLKNTYSKNCKKNGLGWAKNTYLKNCQKMVAGCPEGYAIDILKK